MSGRQFTRITPRPFLKWVGGKGQLLPALLEQVNNAGAFHRYHEPFVGGGALFFEMYRQRRLGRSRAYLSDTNPSLIEAYCAVRDELDKVIELLQGHKARHSEGYFYEVRGQVPQSPAARAARIIYLNKTCFNGLFRENSRGEFNTPFGRYKNPAICDQPNLRAVAEALKHARIENRPFASILDQAAPGDFVYFDPPYHPLSKTASFTRYDRSGFGEDAQRELASVFAELTRRNVKALLSNSYTPLIRSIYDLKKVTIDEVLASRNVNSRADRRGKISEALIRNF